MRKYYLDDDHPGRLIRYTEPAVFHVLLKGEADWYRLPKDNSYLREQMRTAEEVAEMADKCLKDL